MCACLGLLAFQPIEASLILSSSDISNGGTLELGTYVPGQSDYNLPGPYTANNSSAYPGIALRCQNDTAVDWYLNISGTALTQTSTGATLPRTAFQSLPTYAQYSNSATTPPDSNNNAVLRANLYTTTFASVSSTPITLYRSLSGTDYNITTGSNYIQVKTQFAVIVPGSAAAGLYSSSLTFTLTE